jgi:soluble lytic murein transglycosylase-like protein
MKPSTILTIGYLMACITTIVTLSGMSSNTFDSDNKFTDEESVNPNSTVSIQMYEYIERYSDEYNIPKYVAYNVAYKETTYRGPFDWRYNPARTSCVGALGPMQIMPTTSYSINKVKYSNNRIMTDIELNIKTSMKLLRKLHNRYGDWSLVCGHYNTGRPIVNEYGRYCGTNKDYKSKWLSLK